MKILLLNDNPVVNKLVTLSAQKTSDELDIVDSIDAITSREYNLLVVDDTKYNEDLFEEIKGKITFSSSLYICARDAVEVEAFTATIKKPFLPTDLVEIFSKFSKEATTISSSPVENTENLVELDELEGEELVLDEAVSEDLDVEGDDLDLSLDDDLDLDDLSLGDDDLSLEDDDADILDEPELDNDLSFDDETLDEGESVLDDEEAQKVKDLLDETSDDEEGSFDSKITADEIGLPLEEVEEFLQDFIDQANAFKDELYSSAHNGDTDKVKELSHKLKGVAANLRIPETMSQLETINSSTDLTEIESNLNEFYKTINTLGVKDETLDTPNEEEISDEVDGLVEFTTEEELELSEAEENSEASADVLDDLELDEALTLDEEETEKVADSLDDLDLGDDLILEDEEVEEIEEESEPAEEVEQADEELAEELDLEDELTLNEQELEEPAEELSDETEEIEEVEEATAELDLDDELTFDDGETEEEPTEELEDELTIDEQELEETAEESVEELEEEDLEAKIEEAVSELTEEDMEAELDSETLLNIASSEIDSLDSLNSNDLKLALNEEVEVAETDMESDTLETQESEETSTTELESSSEQVEKQTNSIEALENLLEVLKDKNIMASMKGQKIKIKITIGEE